MRIPVNGDMGNGLNIVVSSQGHRGPGYSLGFNGGEHRIEGLLPNGNYVVDAVSYGENSASGTTTLRVAGGSAEGPALTLVPNSGIVLNVKEEFTSGPAYNVARDYSGPVPRFPLHGPLAYLSANLEPADDFGQGVQGSLRPPLGPNDDSLVLTNVPPGRYWLRLYSARGYVASATMGAIDLLHQPLVVSAGSAASVDVTLRDEYSSVEGKVTGWNPDASKSDDPNSQNVWIYFVPLPDGPGQFQQFGVAANENFTSQNMAPGSYRVLAFAHQKENLPYRDPQAMKAYETKGQVIHLAPGQKSNLQLQIISED